MNRLRVSALILTLGVAACRSAPAVIGVSPSVGGAEPAVAANGPAYNVLLITLDTTRADHLGAYGATQALTPALDQLAASGTVFEQAFTSSPQTLPSHGTLLTGLQPPEHGLRSNGRERLPANVPTMASVLSARGYRTGAFTAAFVLDSKFGLDRGFDVYDDDLSQALPQDVPEALSVYRPADVVADSALAWLGAPAKDGGRDASEAQPFFAWMHLYDPHYPHHAHAQLEETRYAGVASYDAEIAFMDQQIGRVLAFLEQRGLRERTLVIAVADHGEGLEDHREVEHGYLLNEEVLHVPLIVSLPGVVRAGQRVPAMVSTVDLFPTVLDVTGAPAERGQGRSLAGALRGEAIEPWSSYAETDLPFTVFGWSPLRSITAPGWKYVRSTRPELYDRGNDRAELYNLASARPEQAGALEAQLATIESRMQRDDGAAAGVELSVADKDRLTALGYAGEHQAPDAEAAAPTIPPGLKDIKDMIGVKAMHVVLMRGLADGTLDVERRLEISRQLVDASPETAIFHAELGQALFAAAKPVEAASAYEAALARQPDLISARLGLGQALAAQGKPEEARKHVFEVLRLQPDSADAHFLAGNVLAAAGELDTALGHYAEAVRVQPSHADAYYNMANALAFLGQTARAEEKYEAALRLRPDFAAAHFNLATLLSDRSSLDLAATHFAEVLRLEPAMIDAGNRLGLVLEAQGKIGEAEVRFAETVDRAPGFAAAHHNLARMLARRGEEAGALRHHEEAHRLRPDDASFAAALALMLASSEDRAARDPEQAVALAETAVEQTRRRDAGALKILAVAYASAHRPEESTRAAQMALALAHAAGDALLAGEIK